MCTFCSTVFLERLKAVNLTFDDLRFGEPPDDDATDAEIDQWNARAARAYKGRFLLVRLRKERRRFSQRARE